MSQIIVKNLSFIYPHSERKVLDDLSFVIEKGSYTAIVGYNGSGKSSLARLICGLELPSSGFVEIARENKIGIVFQSPKDQIVSGIVSRDTAFAPQCQLCSKSETELRTIESLNIVDMLSYAPSSTSALSLGQTQKIAISGVIAMRPEILILDEAISMLDAASREEILDFVRYWHKCGNTIIQITHDLRVVEEADSVIGLENGKMFFYGRKNAFLENQDYKKMVSLPVLQKASRGKNASSEILKKEVSLSARNLSFSYIQGEKHILHNVSFDLHRGSLVALTGVSGAGKSTLLEICSGLLSYQGQVFCFGAKAVLAQQNSSAALFETFAADDVAFGPANYGKKGKELLNIVKKSMEDAAIPYETFGNRRTQALSGGEKRRLSIAGILSLDADVIFFDEPTSGLDSITRVQVLSMLKRLADEGKTVLFSTHHQSEADFADREMKIENGTIAYDSLLPIFEEKKSYEAKRKKDFEIVAETKGENVNECKNETESKNETECENETCKLPLVKPLPYSKMLQLLNSISLSLSGSKRKKKSSLERLPAPLRLLLFLLLFVVSLISHETWFCFLSLLVSLVYCALAAFSFKNLRKSALKILPFLLFFCVFQIIFHPALENEIHFTNWRWFCITPSKLLLCLNSIIRTYSSLACISAFFVSMPEYDLIDSFKVLLSPLEKLKIPVRYFILIVEIVFRFIPLLVEEAICIIKTQIIRGGLMELSEDEEESSLEKRSNKGKRKNIDKKQKEKKSGKNGLKAIMPLIVPLIIQTIRRSESLADAITMRGFE